LTLHIGLSHVPHPTAEILDGVSDHFKATLFTGGVLSENRTHDRSTRKSTWIRRNNTN